VTGKNGKGSPVAYGVDVLTKVGPGTPMGDFMRQFWLPVAKASEVEVDGAPLRLMVLGEKLIAFRDSSGAVGVLDHRCPHRCASLFFGLNEEGGLRCSYHGWKFDVEGNCIEMPNVLPSQDFSKRVKAKAYKARERNGMIWLYMGPRETPPPLPQIGIVNDEPHDLIIDMTARDCNWLQALEGDIDPSHLSFLHHGKHSVEQVKGDFVGEWITTDARVRDNVVDTGWGVMEGHVRPHGNAPNYWHYSQQLFPTWTMPGQDEMHREHPVVRFWLPIDDEHSMNIQFMLPGGFDPSGQPQFFAKKLAQLPGVRKRSRDFLTPNTTDWYGRWNISPALENDFFMYREVQRHESFTGIEGVQVQDKAITESMGPIVDRTFETLSPADLMIATVRRRLIEAVTKLEAGETPEIVDKPELYLGAFAGGVRGGDTDDWVALYRKTIAELGLPEPAIGDRRMGPDARVANLETSA